MVRQRFPFISFGCRYYGVPSFQPHFAQSIKQETPPEKSSVNGWDFAALPLLDFTTDRGGVGYGVRGVAF